jgi:crotonobetainyl-CoA:carnitine CoA-transferase CaiB-like acyl-CoA transferase
MEATTMATGPLDGIRVLEFTQIIAGPFACQNLADMGAEVIKVEPPEGEPWRQFSQFMPGEAKYFQSLNRGKKSLVLALQEPAAQEIVHRLMPEIDVVVVNYRPDVPARLRIDYDTLSKIKPNLIYVDNTAFGRKGPWSHRPGYDVVVQAVSGLMAGEGKVDADGAPEAIRSTPIADYGTGLAIAWGVCAALYHRERTGEGQLITSTLLNTALAFQGSVVFDLPVADEMVRMRMGRLHQLEEQGAPYPDLVAAHNPMKVLAAGNIYYRAYATKDGALAVGALSASLWAKVRKAIGTEFLGMADPQYNPLDAAWQAKAHTAVAEVEQILRSKTTEEWMEIFDREGVPAGPVNFPEDLIDDPQVQANEMMVSLDHELAGPQRQVGPILGMSKTPLAAQGASPRLGADTDDYVRRAGYSDAEIAKLREQGLIA